eukprot:gene21236-27515_t
MIAANKNLIKATLTQGVLGIHLNLIQLYQYNLSALATQAALIAGFSSSSLGNINSFTGTTYLTLAYFYYIFYTICFVSALAVLSQSTVVVTFGPSFALKGTTSDSVKIAAIHIMYNVFKDPEDDKLLDCEEVGQGRLKLTGKYYSVDGKGEGDTVSTAEIVENTKLKARGLIWKRQPVEQGGLFVKYYAVLEKGKLDFYKNTQEYKDGFNPVNPTPLKLWELEIETDIKKFENKVISLRSVLTSTIVGNDEFTISDIMSSDYDLKYASKNYRFALIPKVASELTLQTVIELVAHDEKAYNQWIAALRTVIEAYDILAENPTVEQTMRVGTSSVDTVVLAANK